MGEIGRNIVNSFRELRKFCKDVSLLLMSADGLMLESGWRPFPRIGVLGARSFSVDQSQWWLPLEFVRYYESSDFKNLLPYIVILVDDIENNVALDEALLSAGILDYGANGTVADWGYWFSHWHLWMPNRKDDGTLCFEDPRQTWGKEKPPQGIVKVTTFAYPLEDITSSESLNQKVIRPLISTMVKGNG